MIEFNALIPFTIFCIVMTITPGPNNAFVMISGAKYGFNKTIPLILGIAIGIGLQLSILGFGFQNIFKIFPKLHVILNIISMLYILWLSWKIAISGPIQTNLKEKPTMGFLDGLAFQWMNPKAWLVSISIVTTYLSLNNNYLDVIIYSAFLIFITLPCVGVWAIFGLVLRKHLTNPKLAIIFNISMAILLIIAIAPSSIKSLINL